MRTFLLYLPAFACLAMMAAICVPTMRHMGMNQHHVDASEEIAALREEVARLKAERVLKDKVERVDG